MSLSGAQVTQHSHAGIHQIPFGSFAGKSAQVIVVPPPDIRVLSELETITVVSEAERVLVASEGESIAVESETETITVPKDPKRVQYQ